MVVHEIFELVDGLGEFFLLEVGVGDAELGEARVLRVAVFALHFAKQRLRLDPVVRGELFIASS